MKKEEKSNLRFNVFYRKTYVFSWREIVENTKNEKTTKIEKRKKDGMKNGGKHEISDSMFSKVKTYVLPSEIK